MEINSQNDYELDERNRYPFSNDEILITVRLGKFYFYSVFIPLSFSRISTPWEGFPK